ncbi:hypothetical protein C5U48_02625 [Mycolicibacter virginiensis]|uniref:Uncharacterized protein n=1 Tax=Mycolicibacter virginiensis TaxID=1795032 RepID=A0A9X7P027_9MYCO|nr:hypothetical protein [Mycolicibacter virginiensis]PQM53723.1 hypothetical protein C5U48_02625 [Mycolicibacter virginiensis]
MDPVTAAQIRRFVVTPLAPAGATDEQLDRALDAVLVVAPLDSWRFDGHWYVSELASVADLQRIVDEVVGGKDR